MGGEAELSFLWPCVFDGTWWMITSLVYSSASHPGAQHHQEGGLGGDLLGIMRWCMERAKKAFKEKLRDPTIKIQYVM